MAACTHVRALNPSDSNLVVQAEQGNQQAFEILVSRYHTALFNFIFRYMGDKEQTHDILQHVFFQLYLSLPKLSTSLSTERTREPLKAWLFQVAHNRCMDEQRRKRPLLFSEVDIQSDKQDRSLLEMLPDAHPLPEEIAEQHDLECRLRKAISMLPPRFRPIVFLRYTTEWTFVEIGRELNIPENTAKTYFQRARPLLRHALGRYEDLYHASTCY